MKQIVYLSILAILIVLSSCKGNSFMTRKYTHFKNGHKNVNKERLATLHNRNQVVVVTPAEMIETSLASAEAGSWPIIYSEKIAVGKSPAAKAPVKFHAIPVKNSDKEAVAIYDSHSPTLLVHQKARTESKQSHVIIDEILGLVIWIIMVCVLVAAILLLVILL